MINIINVMSRALTREGYDVHTARPGEAALEVLKTKTFYEVIKSAQGKPAGGIEPD